MAQHENIQRSKIVSYTKRKITNTAMIGLAYLSLTLALVPLFSILLEVIVRGISAINLDFLTQLPKAVGEAGGGIANAIQGTIILLALACLIGVPIGVFSGVYLAEYSETKLASIIRFFTEVLAESPSIVIGIFVYTLIVIYMRSFSAIAGSLALAIIMIPIVSRTTEEAVKLVPVMIREAALALGIARWRTTLKIVLSTAKKGIIVGIMLSVARISGETAPLLLTAFNSLFYFTGLDKPVASIPMYIFTYAISPFSDWQAKAWGAALILILIVLILNVTVRILTRGKYEHV